MISIAGSDEFFETKQDILSIFLFEGALDDRASNSNKEPPALLTLTARLGALSTENGIRKANVSFVPVSCKPRASVVPSAIVSRPTVVVHTTTGWWGRSWRSRGWRSIRVLFLDTSSCIDNRIDFGNGSG